MNPQLIAAFHAHESFSDIIDTSGTTNKQFEQAVIQFMRAAHPIPPTPSLPINMKSSCSEQKSGSAPDSPMDALSGALSYEQMEFVRMTLQGESVFLTAPAGFGKSYAIAEAVAKLRQRLDNNPDQPSRVAICASTGKAASLIGGRTIHSYLGIGLAKQSADLLYEKLVTTRRLKPKYLELKSLHTLIIDEISMVNDVLLNKISEYLELIKNNTQPFGGVQMIFVGDLHQLAPVEGKYFISAASYTDLCPIVLQLTKCFRQDNPVFQQILAEARIGQLSKDSFEVLMNQNKIDPMLFPGMQPTIICSTNREVDAINQRELNKLTTERHTYEILPIARNAKKIEIAAKLDAIPEAIELAVDAQIMITTNISMGGGRTIANGTQGKIVSMHDTHINCSLIGWGSEVKIGFQKVLDPDCIDEDSNPVYLFEYLPVRLGFAASIHRAQGMTCDLLEVDLNRVFAAGQAYVAISRVRSLEGLKLIGLKRNAFITDPRISEFYRKY